MDDLPEYVAGFEHWIEAIGTRAAAATNPLFRVERNGRRCCTASCVLLRIGPQVAVVTASHALETGREYYFGAHDQILPVAGEVRRTVRDEDASDPKDWIDLVVVLLPDEISEKIDSTLPITLHELDDLAKPRHRPIYLAVGYPYTKQKPHRRTGEIAATPHRIALMRGPLRDYFDLGLDPIANLLLRFDKHRAYRKGVAATSPDPKGMSGGSLWLLPDDVSGVPRLAGFLTEWQKQRRKRLVATRAHVALQLLVELEPDLTQYLAGVGIGNAT